MKTSLTRSQWVLIVVLTLAAAPYFVRLGASSLWDSNEAFYAETPREMIESKDYINPTFNYRPRLNKPPLSYWIVIPFYQLFGVSETAERLPIALGALIMIGTAYGLGRAVYSVEAGLIAAIALAVAPRFLMFSRRIMIDVYLAAFMGLALLMFVLAEKRSERRRLYLILMYVALGLGVITKGPVAVVLPALAFAIYIACFRRFYLLREMMIPTGILIVAAIVLPWYLAIYYQHGWSHIEAFLLKDNLSRYTEAVWGPRRGLFFYIPALLGDFFPWSLFLIPVAWYGIRRFWASYRSKSRLTPNLSTPAMLTIWVAVIIVFFSISRSKEDLYILPVYPAVAALVGGFLGRFITTAETPPMILTLTTVTLGVSLVLGGVAILFLFGPRAQGYAIAGASFISFAAAAGGVIAVIAALLRRTRTAILATAISVTVCNWVFVISSLPDFERFKPVRSLCKVIDTEAGTEALVGYYRMAYPSMVFYLGRPIFEYYREPEIDAAFSSGKEVFCVMTEAEYESFSARVPFKTQVLASHPIFQVKLNVILDKLELPRVVLISNKGGTNVTK